MATGPGGHFVWPLKNALRSFPSETLKSGIEHRAQAGFRVFAQIVLELAECIHDRQLLGDAGCGLGRRHLQRAIKRKIKSHHDFTAITTTLLQIQQEIAIRRPARRCT